MSAVLLVSIVIRFFGLGLSLLMLKRLKDWRIGFFSAMLFLMALRQIFTLTKDPINFPVSFTASADEVPGLLVSVLAVLALIFLERMIGQRESLNANLKTAEERFRNFAESASDYFWEMDRDLRFSYFSDRFAEITGDAPEKLLGRTRAETVVPNVDEAVWRQHLSDLAAHRAFSDFVHASRKSNGEVVWVSTSGCPVVDKGGRFKGYRGTGTDITRRMLVEEELRRSEVSLRTAQRIAHLGSWEWKIGTDTVDWSNEMYRIFGFEPGEITATPDLFYSRVHPDDLELVKSADETAALKGKGHGVEYRVTLPNRSERVVLERTEVSYDDSGVATHMNGTVLDITERRQAEEQLRQAQRMETIGQLTGGVAHDFNNLLGVIQGNAELLAAQSKSPDPEIEAIIRSAKRGGELTHRLLAFSRKQALRPEPVSADKLIHSMLDLLRRSLGETVEIEVVGDAGLWLTEIDPGQLENAILNLAINARDAMPNGGSLTIESSNVRMTDEYAAAQAEVAPGQYILVAVTDTGSGMSAEVREHAFEPFFTTKDTGKGTGLGLSMVFGFVKQSGGHVAIYSEVGEGSTIKLYLPRYLGDRATVDENKDMQLPEPAKGEVILLVEDDADLQSLVVNQLQSLSYEVLPTASGKSALEILRDDSRVNLLLTDVVLPGGMSGVELANRAKEIQPNLPVLYMSGYTQNSIIHRGRLDQGVQLLEKPFSISDLARKVRDTLHRTKP